VQHVGPYQLVREVARGGMGVVYQARGPDGREVALKLLLAQRATNPAALKRFQVEVQALARLRHPNVVSILAAGEARGVPWLALDYVEGETLAARLRRGPLGIDEAIRFGQQLARALDYVHGCGVLHRDLKPGNVLLRGGQALLTDFGLARDADSSISRITASGVFQGTPGYWAPEQAQGRLDSIGPRTDLFGLGGVLYACLTGRQPIEAQALQEYLEPARWEQIPPPRRLRPEVPAWLSALCMECLRVTPADRPRSAEAVARALLEAGKVGSRRGRRALPLALGAIVLALGAGLWVALEVDADPGSATAPTPRASVEPAPHPQPRTVDPDPAPEKTGWPRGVRVEAPARDVAGESTPEARAAAVRLLAEAGRLVDAQRWQEALPKLDEVLRLDPQSTEAYLGRAFTHGNLGQHQLAIADFDAVLRLDPNRVQAYAGRGAALERMGRFEEALACYEQALRLDPNDARSLTNRGALRAYTGDTRGALADYDAALRVMPGLRKAHHGRGTVLHNLGRYEEALAEFERAIAIQPLGDTYRERGWTLLALERTEEALECYALALRFTPRDPLIYTQRAMARRRLGDLSGALTDLDLALQLDPRSYTALALRGETRLNLGQWEAAIADLDLALAANLPPARAEGLRSLRARAKAGLAGQE